MLLVPIYQPSAPRAELRASSQPVSDNFLNVGGYESSRSLALFVDGLDTGWRIARGFTLSVKTNLRGDLAGSLEGTFSGAYTATYYLTFVKPHGGRVRFLTVPKGHEDLRLMDLDDRGRTLTLATQHFWGPGMDDPTYCVPHAVIWDRGTQIDIGPAMDAHWSRDAVRGEYYVDPSGHPVTDIIRCGETCSRRFVWRHGRRTNAPVWSKVR